jgi:hypothetical protein
VAGTSTRHIFVQGKKYKGNEDMEKCVFDPAAADIDQERLESAALLRQ